MWSTSINQPAIHHANCSHVSLSHHLIIYPSAVLYSEYVHTYRDFLDSAGGHVSVFTRAVVHRVFLYYTPSIPGLLGY